MTRKKTYSRAAAIMLAMLMIFGAMFASMLTVSAADEGTLNIHKLSATGVSTKEAGKYYFQHPETGLYHEYLAGAKYTVYKIGTFEEENTGTAVSVVYTPDPSLRLKGGAALGPTTRAGDIDLDASAAVGLTGSAETDATTAAGPLSITSGLDTNGVYLIVESTLPTGISAGEDFIITVPMYNAAANSGAGAWETTIDAYPKNSESDGTIEKTITQVDGASVSESGNTFYANTGSTVTYSVAIKVPTDYTTTATDPLKNYTEFDIIDSSSQYLALRYTMNPEDGITITGTTSGTFIAGTDYTATYVPGTGGANNMLKIKFTAAGLGKIEASETLTVTYDAEIIAGAAGSSEALVNKAWIEFKKGAGGGTITPPPTDPPVTVKIFSYGVKKMNDATTPAPLAGASFVLAKDDGSGGYDYLSYNATTETWGVVTQATAQVFTTSTSGSDINSEAILQFKNLDPAKTYYLIETAAPAGYIKLLSPIEMKATAATTNAVYNTYDDNGDYAADTGYTVKITNVSDANGGLIGGGGLPTTGGNGIYLYLIIGAVLMGAAVIFYIRLRKKNKASQ